MKIAVIDSEVAIAESLVNQLRLADFHLTVGVAAESLTKLLATPEAADGFDVVLLDSCFGGLVAVESHVRLCRRKGWPVVVHSHEPGSSIAGRGLRAGAVATISKFADLGMVTEFLARVASGRVVVNSWWARALLASGPVRGEAGDVDLVRGVAAGVPLSSLAQWHGRSLSDCEAAIFRVAERNCGGALSPYIPKQVHAATTELAGTLVDGPAAVQQAASDTEMPPG